MDADTMIKTEKKDLRKVIRLYLFLKKGKRNYKIKTS